MRCQMPPQSKETHEALHPPRGVSSRAQGHIPKVPGTAETSARAAPALPRGRVPGLSVCCVMSAPKVLVACAPASN